MADLCIAVERVLPSVIADLKSLVRIPSVSADPARAGQVRASAEVVSVRGGAPAVIASWPAPDDAPTVLLYAHHDAQPTGEPAQWSSEPFQPTERQGRLYGRGVADDKAGVMAHIATLRAYNGRPPVGVTLFVEGEEEIGLVTRQAARIDYPESLYRAEASVRESVKLVGSGSLAERLWTRPCISVLGLDAPRVAEAGNVLVPAARAKVSMRIGPGQHPGAALDALTRHIQSHAEFGAEVTVSDGLTGPPSKLDTTSPAFAVARQALTEAFGKAPVQIGIGGSIPSVAEFSAAFPDAAVLVIGTADPGARIHGPDEGLHLAQFAKVCLAQTLMLDRLARS